MTAYLVMPGLWVAVLGLLVADLRKCGTRPADDAEVWRVLARLGFDLPPPLPRPARVGAAARLVVWLAVGVALVALAVARR